MPTHIISLYIYGLCHWVNIGAYVKVILTLFCAFKIVKVHLECIYKHRIDYLDR